MNHFFYFSILLSLTLACQPAAQEPTSTSPNIVLILADDMGSGDIQALNPSSQLPTPALNALAESGMRFTDAHTGSSVCTPTRYGLMTGRYAWRTRLKSGVLSGYSDHLIEEEHLTIAQLLQQQGYHTGVVGKWHLGLDFPWRDSVSPQLAENPRMTRDNLNYCALPGEIDYRKPVQHGPNERGFDYSFLVPGSLDMSPYVYIENGKATMLPDSISPRVPFPSFQRKGEISPDFVHEACLDHLTEKATAFIADQAKKRQPFFLYFPLTGPHKPALAAKRFQGKSGLGPYGDLVMQVDWTVGQVMEQLKASGVEDNTLVMYTSDNGSYMYRLEADEPDHQSDSTIQAFAQNHHRSNAGWRGTKADIWEAGHRVPFLVRWPGKVEPGSVATQAICLTDVWTTIAELLSLPKPANQAGDSFSFASLLQGGAGFEREPIIHHSVGGMFAIRSGPWKLVAGNGSGGREQPRGKAFEEPYQLFNLEKDPGEEQNAIDFAPAKGIADSLVAELNRIREADR